MLRCVPGLGVVGLRRALDAAGGVASAALQALAPSVQEAAHERAQRVIHQAGESGLGIVTWDAPPYPEMLRDLEDLPPVLFVAGDVQRLARPAVAVVGTRKATSYGLRVTAQLAAALGEAGVTVVSGLARGIDAAAHEAALLTEGGTVAVLGTGADVPYPRENAGLHRRIVASGLVLSELLPGAPPHSGSFPRRNRLVAALADVTVVVEAGVRSGALITATIADSLGRLVAAVPGPIDVAASQGANQLLRDGRHVVTGAEDLLSLVHLTHRGREMPRRSARVHDDAPVVQGDEALVLAVVRDGPRLPDELIAATGLSASRLAAALGALGERGITDQDASGWIAMARVMQ